MYLIWRKQENLYLMRMDIIEFRTNYYKMTVNNRVIAAKRFKKLYLTKTALFPIEWPDEISDPSIEEVLEKTWLSIEAPEIHVFDDIGFLALQALEKAFLGQFKPTPNLGEGYEDRFEIDFASGPFYQAMRNDLGL
jgi:hypothetical protein